MTCEVREVEVSAIRPAIDGVVRRRFGSVEVDLTDDGNAIVGTVVQMTVDPVKLQLDRSPGDIVVVEVLAPFPVHVDKATNQVVAEVIAVPMNAWPLVAGLRVREGGRDGRIVAVDGVHASLVDPNCPGDSAQSSPTRVGQGVWFGLGGLALAGAAFVGVLVARRMG